MKKVICMMAVLLMLMCPVMMPTQAATVILGDLDGDTDCDSDDLTLLAKNVAKITTLTGDAAIAADVDKNGTVDSDDLTLVAKYVAKIISTFETDQGEDDVTVGGEGEDGGELDPTILDREDMGGFTPWQ